MSDYQIGKERFITISDPPPGAQEQIALEARGGVDGTFAWKTGRRGEPFTLTTFVDLATLSDAGARLRRYEKISGGDAVIVRWAGFRMELKVIVLAVRAVVRGVRPTVISVGGRVNNSRATLTCEWDLISII